MLIEFTVGNYRSFREPVTLSMEAAKINSEDPEVDRNNLIHCEGHQDLLTSAAIYGANASGKSNLIQAMAFMRGFVTSSARESQAGDPISVSSFRLNTGYVKRPSFFEIIFTMERQLYRYGFEVNQELVTREWLYTTPTIREAALFTREGSIIIHNKRSFREGRNLADKTRPNALFLSVVAQFNGEIATKIIKWFRTVNIISGLEDVGYRSFTVSQYLDNMSYRDQIQKLICSLDVGIEKIAIEKVASDKVEFPKEMPEELKKLLIDSPGEFVSVNTEHTVFDEMGQATGFVSFDLEDEESEGTQKLFSLSGPIIDTLQNGEILFVDEMEARLHPLLTQKLVGLFNSIDTNPKRAQIIFTTHDTNLLDKDLFRRDQIWFVEKDSTAASHLYSLAEFKIRNDKQYERNYLRGKFGAIPYLGDFFDLPLENADPKLEQDHAA